MPAPAPGPRHSTNIASLLNDESESPNIILDENQLRQFHELLVQKTSGCSLEQLEQVNAALMDAIWGSRGEYNRNQVIHKVQDAFNVIIEDIQTIQKIMKASQDEPEHSQAPSVPVYGTQYPTDFWDPTRQQSGRRGVPTMEPSQF